MLRTILLIVLDGWGISESSKGNALKEANLPTIEKLNSFYPRINLNASGISVGLPWGEPGNSEVGHMTIGTGRITYQNMPRIGLAIQSQEFFKNQALLGAFENAKKTGGSIHLMGLLGTGSVHSYKDHLYALLEMAKSQDAKKVFLHIFTDGRDSDVKAGLECLKELKDKLGEFKVGEIATIMGRSFAMDRNNNWDRIEKAYLCLTEGQGEEMNNPLEYLEKSYRKGVSDEYIEPGCLMGDSGKFEGAIKNGDSVIFFNFREDRARELTKAFTVPGFSKFKRKEFLKELYFAGMTLYEEGLPIEVAFPPVKVSHSLGEIVSKKGLAQLRIAETEKFAHVTYFFNGGQEEVYPKEDRIIVPSPTHVERYDKAPEMSAKELTEKVIAAIRKEKYGFILANFANPDMVGHTGNLKASIKAVETVDSCLSQIIPEILQKDGCLLITADHGNVEEVNNSKTGEADTEHSSNPVPLWFITSENHSEKPRKVPAPDQVQGMLGDIAPTILELMKTEKPKEMTGESLLSLLK
ncbi:MAG: 2,3-bisphosphoglycerate-independent phosphoglycerate mutase [Patescibacteria group bacterium]